MCGWVCMISAIVGIGSFYWSMVYYYRIPKDRVQSDNDFEVAIGLWYVTGIAVVVAIVSFIMFLSQQPGFNPSV